MYLKYNKIIVILKLVMLKRAVELKGTLEIYLKENIDENISIHPWSGKKKIPLFLLELYNFYETKILGQNCIIIEILQEAPGIDTIKKHIKVISRTVEQNLVFYYKSISWFRRKSLIQNRVPFVVEDGQMYLPFLGLDLKKILDKQIKEVTKFSSSTQLAFLYLLYNGDRTINATELAAVLNTSKMTASRSLNDLYDVGLLTYEICGETKRSKKYKRIGDTEYYNEGSRYLKNPVWKTVYTCQKIENSLVAGLEALSLISMMNPPQKPVVAITKERLREIEPYLLNDRDRILDQKLTEIQVWSYDPRILSKEYYVDLVSLALSLKEFNDERIEQALEERLKGEKWYMG